MEEKREKINDIKNFEKRTNFLKPKKNNFKILKDNNKQNISIKCLHLITHKI